MSNTFNFTIMDINKKIDAIRYANSIPAKKNLVTINTPTPDAEVLCLNMDGLIKAVQLKMVHCYSFGNQEIALTNAEALVAQMAGARKPSDDTKEVLRIGWEIYQMLVTAFGDRFLTKFWVIWGNNFEEWHLPRLKATALSVPDIRRLAQISGLRLCKDAEGWYNLYISSKDAMTKISESHGIGKNLLQALAVYNPQLKIFIEGLD